MILGRQKSSRLPTLTHFTKHWLPLTLNRPLNPRRKTSSINWLQMPRMPKMQSSMHWLKPKAMPAVPRIPLMKIMIKLSLIKELHQTITTTTKQVMPPMPLLLSKLHSKTSTLWEIHPPNSTKPSQTHSRHTKMQRHFMMKKHLKSKLPPPSKWLPSLHARLRNTTSTTPHGKPPCLIEKKLSKISKLCSKPTPQQREAQPVPDARRPCQTVPGDKPETRPPVMKDSAVVLPGSQWAMSWWPSKPAKPRPPSRSAGHQQEAQWPPPCPRRPSIHSPVSMAPRSSPLLPLPSPPQSTCWPELAEHLLHDWSIRLRSDIF